MDSTRSLPMPSDLVGRLERLAGELRGENARELIDALREAASALRAGAELAALRARVESAVAVLSRSWTVSQFMGPNDMALTLLDERATVARLLAAPAGGEG